MIVSDVNHVLSMFYEFCHSVVVIDVEKYVYKHKIHSFISYSITFLGSTSYRINLRYFIPSYVFANNHIHTYNDKSI